MMHIFTAFVFSSLVGKLTVNLKILQFVYSFLYATKILDSLSGFIHNFFLVGGGRIGQWLNEPIIPSLISSHLSLCSLPPPKKKNGLKVKHSFPQYGLGSFKN
jgi:hypothetical protein